MNIDLSDLFDPFDPLKYCYELANERIETFQKYENGVIPVMPTISVMSTIPVIDVNNLFTSFEQFEQNNINKLAEIIKCYIYFVEHFLIFKNRHLGKTLNNLGSFICHDQNMQNKRKLIVKCFKLEIRSGYITCYHNLGNYYDKLGESGKAIRCWEMEVEFGGFNSLRILASRHYETNRRKSIMFLKKGCKNNDPYCAFLLVAHYHDNYKYEKMMKYCNIVLKHKEEGILCGHIRYLIGINEYLKGSYHNAKENFKIGSELGNTDCQTLFDAM